MDLFTRLPHAAQAATVLGTVFILYHVYRSVALWRRRSAYKRSKGVLPVPWLRQHPLLLGFDTMRDNNNAFRNHRLQELQLQRFRRAGKNTLQLYLLGRHGYTTIEPENLKVIQALDHKKWCLNSRRKSGFQPLLGKGIFTTDGAEWQHSREMLRPNFTRSQIADLDTFEAHTSRLMTQIPRDGTTVDLSELFFRLTMDSATDFLFGESTHSLSKGSGQQFADAFARSQRDAGDRVQYHWLYNFMPGKMKADKDIELVHNFVDYYVRQGLARRPQLLREKQNPDHDGRRYVFLEELVRQTDDPVRIRSELLNILLAGRDTTASLLTNVWFTLGKRPDIWHKLQAEVATLDGNRPTFVQIKDLRYLRALLNESLRLYPVVPANSREAVQDTTLPLGGGPDGSAPIFVKKGQLVSWSVYTMHRRKDLYGDDADEFLPERWLDDPQTGKRGLRPSWEYLPFNGGARICLGQQFALAEASYTTIRLCQEFDRIECRDFHEWEECLMLTMTNLRGAPVGLFPRDEP